jgi:hypothetical protein
MSQKSFRRVSIAGLLTLAFSAFANPALAQTVDGIENQRGTSS